MPKPGDDVGRQTQRAIESAQRDAGEALGSDVTVKIEIDPTIGGGGGRDVILTTTDRNGRALPLHQVLLRVYWASKTFISTQTANPDLLAAGGASDVEAVKIDAALLLNSQDDDGVGASYKLVQVFIVRTNAKGVARFEFIGYDEDVVRFAAYPFPAMSKTIDYTWKN